jgi:hypothetical protein
VEWHDDAHTLPLHTPDPRTMLANMLNIR